MFSWYVFKYLFKTEFKKPFYFSVDLHNHYLVDYNYVGCFKDSGNEDMGAPQTVNGKFTAVSLSDKAKDGVSTRACATHCKKENFRYFGMMYGGACRCSNSYGSKGEDPNGCTMDCFQGTDNN